MPIYAYRCGQCGHTKDVLQKMSDALLTVCPACNSESFSKQVTAAGFALKGSGWYVTDFRGNNASSDSSNNNSTSSESTSVPSSTPNTTSDTISPTTNTTSSTTASATACASGCGCH